MQHAARKFYLQDKEAAIAGNTAKLAATWRKLIGDIVEGQRSGAFLVRRDRRNLSGGVLDLHDARLIPSHEPRASYKEESRRYV